MEWGKPPVGSPADRILDDLGRLGKPDWERACRWSSGWDVAATRALAEQAARGGDKRVSWYLPLLEARDRDVAQKNDSPPAGKRDVELRGRPRSDKGWQAYRLKARGGRTWASIARELELSDARKGDVALRMAKRYAVREGLPWPL